MTVNAFVVWDPATGEAGIFDTGAEAEAMLAFIRRKNLAVKSLFITHTHGDHIAAVDQVVACAFLPRFCRGRGKIVHRAILLRREGLPTGIARD